MFGPSEDLDSIKTQAEGYYHAMYPEYEILHLHKWVGTKRELVAFYEGEWKWEVASPFWVCDKCEAGDHPHKTPDDFRFDAAHLKPSELPEYLDSIDCKVTNDDGSRQCECHIHRDEYNRIMRRELDSWEENS